jgi:hypothetical protein
MGLLLQSDNGSVQGANAYIDKDFFTDYHTDRATLPDPAPEDEDIEAAIIRATDYVDRRWRFIGDKPRPSQRTSWPRLNAEDPDGNLRTGIPFEIKEATAEYALQSMTSGLDPTPTPDPSGKLVTSESKTVGPISKSVTYAASGASTFPSFPKADSKLMTSGLVRSSRDIYRA